jgi:CRP-like cAMP-binding protein
MVPKLDQFEVRRLSLGAELVECNAGQVIMTVGKSSSSIFMVLEGELSVLQKEEESRNMVEIGVLRAGMSVGEVGMVTGGKCTSTVKCKTDCSLIEITSEAAEGLILSRPDLVEHVFLIKTVLAEQGEILELICDHIDRVNQLVLLESQERNLEEEGTKGDPPYFSSWSDGKTVEIVEISPPVYGNSPSARGRYERIEELLDVQLYKSMWRGFDTEWGMEIAWNRVFLAKLSPTVKMQFLSEVATTLILTNEQPRCVCLVWRGFGKGGGTCNWLTQ